MITQGAKTDTAHGPTSKTVLAYIKASIGKIEGEQCWLEAIEGAGYDAGMRAASDMVERWHQSDRPGLKPTLWHFQKALRDASGATRRNAAETPFCGLCGSEGWLYGVKVQTGRGVRRIAIPEVSRVRGAEVAEIRRMIDQMPYPSVAWRVCVPCRCGIIHQCGHWRKAYPVIPPDGPEWAASEEWAAFVLRHAEAYLSESKWGDEARARFNEAVGAAEREAAI